MVSTPREMLSLDVPNPVEEQVLLAGTQSLSDGVSGDGKTWDQGLSVIVSDILLKGRQYAEYIKVHLLS